MRNDFDHLIDTKQYYAAAWRAITAGGHEVTDATTEKVSEIAGLAIRHGCMSELRKVAKTFDKHLTQEMRELAATALNETTDIDLQPDEL